MGRNMLRGFIGMVVGAGISFGLARVLPTSVCLVLAMFCLVVAYGSVMPPKTIHDPVQGLDIHKAQRAEYESNWGKRVHVGLIFTVAAIGLLVGAGLGSN